MSRSVTIKRLDDEASAALDNLRYISRRLFIVSGRRNAIWHMAADKNTATPIEWQSVWLSDK
jgi:hypothetical protein